MGNALRNNTMRKSGLAGFTLIEMLIVVVILGIIAAVAYPNYTNYVTKSRRSDATITLTRIAALQERFFTQCGIYAQNFGGVSNNCAAPGTLANTGLTATRDTPDGYYNITLIGLPVVLGGTGNPATSYALTATPIGLQLARDGAKCGTINLFSTGGRNATGTEGNLTNGGNCWR
jgi:type IV pilus assembly protein PilE